MEIVEVAQNELVREQASGEESKYKGLVNQIYSNDLSAILPELFIKKEAYLTLVADYTVGTVTIGTGTTNIIGSSTSWTSANSEGRLIEVSGRDTIYRVTFTAGTDLAFQDSLTWTGSSGSGLTYTLYTDRYTLATDFSHMIADDPEDPHVVYRYMSGNKVFLKPLSEEEFERQNSSGVGTPWGYLPKWIKETAYMYITLAADSAEIIGYSYIPQLSTLTEYTSGTITLTTGTAVIATAAASWLVNVTTGTNTYYIRNDADGTGSNSKWGKILSVANATALTLSSAWAYTSGASISYTISEVSKWPSRFDDAILYKTALILDPDNIQNQKWNAVYQDAIGIDKGREARRMQTSMLKSFPGLRRK
jgi:hypothetical protein